MICIPSDVINFLVRWRGHHAVAGGPDPAAARNHFLLLDPRAEPDPARGSRANHVDLWPTLCAD